MLIFLCEMKKMWRNRRTALGLLVLLLANLYLIALSSKTSFSGNAYRTISKDLLSMSMEQKEQYLADRMEMLDSIKVFVAVESSEKEHGVTEYSVIQKKENEELYRKYYDDYKSQKYVVYTDDYYTEQVFLSYINKEFQSAYKYDKYLKSIIDKADSLLHSNMNSEADSLFRMQSIAMLRDKYEMLNDIPVDYVPCKGIEIPLSTRITDWILLFVSLYFSVSMVYDERKTGMYYLVRSTPLGRKHVAFSKVLAGLISVLLISLIFYGSNFAVFQAVYGYVPMNNSIQSCSCFLSSPFHMNIINTIMLFYVTKAVPIFTVFLMSLLFSAVFDSWSVSFMSTVALIAGGIGIKGLFAASGKWSWIKYLGTLNMMDPQDSIFSYYYLNINDVPISRLSYELLLSLFRIVLLCVAYTLVLSERQTLRSGKTAFALKSSNRKVRSYFEGEWHKFMTEIKNGPVIMVIIIGAILFYSKPNYISVAEQIYRQEMKAIKGEYSQSTYDHLNKWNQEFEPIRTVESEYNSGLITSREYQERMSELNDLKIEYSVFNHIVKEDIPYVISTDGAKLIYGTGYRYLFDTDEKKDKLFMLLSSFITIIVFSNYYLVEEKGKMAQLIRVVPEGQSDLYNAKKKIIMLYSIMIPIIESACRLIRTWIDYGLEGMSYTASSLNWMSNLTQSLSVFSAFLLTVLLKCLCLYTIAVGTTGLSVFTKNLHSTVLISFLFFCLFPTLSYLSESSFVDLSLYNLFHGSVLLKKTSAAETFMLMIVSLIIIGVGSTMIRKYSAGDQ